jgi:hypothetical protein
MLTSTAYEFLSASVAGDTEFASDSYFRLPDSNGSKKRSLPGGLVDY